MEPLKENLLQVASVIRDEVTTTDELIPSGETASYRSNPYKISEFTLIRKDPKYVTVRKRHRSMRRLVWLVTALRLVNFIRYCRQLALQHRLRS